MCGIAGCIGLNLDIGEPEVTQVHNMTRALIHRGPDGEGYYSDHRVAFGHRRLAIIDLNESSNQPMMDSDRDIVIVFNGEIYNYAELRQELETEFTFKTDHSDTETIIFAYKKWGIKCLDRFQGMFAIVLYDIPRQKIYLIRDRLGKKPLYYTYSNGMIYFSSEINPLFTAGVIQRDLNENAIYNYLTFLTTPAPGTFFKNVSKLEMGNYLQVQNGRIKTTCYWDVSSYINRTLEIDYDSARDTTEELLEKAMSYRNVSDVPVNIALSGGLDSSLNLYYSSKINPSLFSANIAYQETSKFDESHLAEQYSKDSGVDFMKIIVTDKVLQETIRDYLAVQSDMPAGDPNTILLFHLSRQMKEKGLKVLMVGEGGDELGGYPIYTNLLKEYKLLSKYKNFPEILKGVFPEKIKRRLDCIYKGRIISRRQVHGFYEIDKASFWMGKKVYNSYDVLLKYMDEIRDDLDDSFLRKVLNIEYKLRLPELILPRIDYPTMASSVEARSPYMDHKLIEFSASLDYNIKMKNGAKSLIKDIARDKLPDYLLLHPKVGFGMLLKPFFKTSLPQWYHTELLENQAPIEKYISRKFLSQLLRQNRNGSKGSKLWLLYALNKWLEKNIIQS